MCWQKKLLCKNFRSQKHGGVVSVYSSADWYGRYSGLLQYGYFITRVVICSPGPHHDSQKTFSF